MSRGSRSPAQTRQLLLEATAREILRKGYAATSLAHTAATLGLTKGAFAHHFPTKAALAAALFAHQDDVLKQIAGAAHRHFPDSGLRPLLAAIGLIGARTQVDPLMQASLVVSTEPGISAFVPEDQHPRWTERFAVMIEAAQGTGELRTGGAPELIATYLLATFAGLHAQAPGEQISPELLAPCVAWSLRGLGADDIAGVAADVLGSPLGPDLHAALGDVQLWRDVAASWA